MLYMLATLSDQIAPLNVFRYITFRTGGAIMTGLLFVFLFGPAMIDLLRVKQGRGQPIREDGPQSHFAKRGTPTMGGLMILGGIVVATLLWANLSNWYVWVVLFVTLSFGAIGFYDDYLKVTEAKAAGFSGRMRLAAEVAVAAIATIAVMRLGSPGFSSSLTVPLFKTVVIPLGVLFVLVGVLVIVGAGNAVNLTDGLDGLAAGTGIIALITFTAISIVTYIRSGNPGGRFDSRLDLATVGAALIGATIGFLWYNAFPAEVIMGDTGAMAIGGALAAMAIFTQTIFLLLFIGGIFLIEALSVIVQVISFKYYGRRVFLMAPIHYHFEMKAWSETKIVVRFWIVTAILCAIGFALFYRDFTFFRR